MKSFIKINPSDNVAVALQPPGERHCDQNLITPHSLLQKKSCRDNKFALKSLKPGDSIIKYGNPIGRATAEIPAGSWIHTHNLKTGWEIFLLIHITKLSQSFHTGSQSSSRAIAEKTVVLVYAMKSGSFLQ